MIGEIIAGIVLTTLDLVGSTRRIKIVEAIIGRTAE